MDAGSEYHGYASDITRTWPVSGKFSDPQRELYEMVLRVHKKCLKVSDIHIVPFPHAASAFRKTLLRKDSFILSWMRESVQNFCLF